MRLFIIQLIAWLLDVDLWEAYGRREFISAPKPFLGFTGRDE